MPMLYIASDHAGFEMKEVLKKALAEMRERVDDLGPATLDPTDDYPDYAQLLATRVAKENGRGILLCGNGIGVCIVANKIRGIRAGTGYSIEAARSMRADANTNVLCLPGRFMMPEEAIEVVTAWLATPFSNARRHVRRLQKVSDLEAQQFPSA